MEFFLQVDKKTLKEFSKNWNKFLIWGIALAVLGIFSITFSSFTTLVSIIVLGGLLTFSGIVIIVDAFQFWMRRGSAFYLHLFMSSLYLTAGILFIRGPEVISMSLTLLLAFIFIILGVARIIYALSSRLPRWGWAFMNGLVTLALGMLMIAEWPASSLFVIGMFIGIDLFICGLAYIMVALSAHKMSKHTITKS